MNYRHAFHAGNFADVFKHAVLLALMEALQASVPALQVIDTHAGAGTYDLAGDEARRTGEAAAGISKAEVADDPPPPVAALLRAVLRLNGGKPGTLYPGSPWLIADALRLADRYTGFELRDDDFARLHRSLAASHSADAVHGDGWQALTLRPPRRGVPSLLLIDPPYEGGDDGVRAAALTRRAMMLQPRSCVAIWTPIKDLASFDALRSEVEDRAGGASVLCAQLRVRRLSDPMRLNGCAMLIARPPAGAEAQLSQVAAWCARVLGETGAVGLTG